MLLWIAGFVLLQNGFTQRCSCSFVWSALLIRFFCTALSHTFLHTLLQIFLRTFEHFLSSLTWAALAEPHWMTQYWRKQFVSLHDRARLFATLDFCNSVSQPMDEIHPTIIGPGSPPAACHTYLRSSKHGKSLIASQHSAPSPRYHQHRVSCLE